MHATDEKILSLMVDIMGREEFSPEVAIKLEFAFWEGALIQSDLYSLNIEDPEGWREISTSLVQWEDKTYYVLRVRDGDGFFPRTDVVEDWMDYSYGYAFFNSFRDLTEAVTAEVDLLEGIPAVLLDERNLVSLAEHKLAGLGRSVF